MMIEHACAVLISLSLSLCVCDLRPAEWWLWLHSTRNHTRWHGANRYHSRRYTTTHHDWWLTGSAHRHVWRTNGHEATKLQTTAVYRCRGGTGCNKALKRAVRTVRIGCGNRREHTLLQAVDGDVVLAHGLDQEWHGKVSHAVSPCELQSNIGADVVVAGVQCCSEAILAALRHKEADKALAQLGLLGSRCSVDGIPPQ
jgi:hypothetical protein